MESEVVLDSSALVAIISGEAEAMDLLERLERFARRILGAPTALETALVLAGRKGLQPKDLSTFLVSIEAVVIPFTDCHADAAIKAFEEFGRGRHPAALNFGDCMSYAVAKVADAPILFVGEDFSKTDLKPA